MRFFSLQVQDLKSPFAELYKVLDKVLVDPLLWPLEIPLIGSTPMGCISHSSVFYIVYISKYEALDSMERKEKRLVLERELNRFNNLSKS